MVRVRFAYLDESGDLAFKRLDASSGTTDYFIVVLLLVDDPLPVSFAIDALKDRLGMRRREEFRFSATSRPRRLAFLEELRRHDVVIRAVVVNKVLIAERLETASERLLYRDLIRRAVIRHQDDLHETTLVLDQYVRGRPAQRQFNSQLRQAVNSSEQRRLVNIRHEDSRANNLIQAADMVAGAIYRARAHNDDVFLRTIRSRVRDIWDWEGIEDPENPASQPFSIPELPRRKKR